MKICITGASSGIGKALAKHLINQGNTVWGIARRKELLEGMKSDFPKGQFFYTVCNVENMNEVIKAKKDMEKSGFSPDVIVLGAAICEDDLNPAYNYEAYKKTFSINLFGSTNFIEAFLNDFLIRKKGQFIALSSISAFRPYLNGISYSATKSALSMTFRGLDLVYRPQGVYFSNIYLGPVNTSMWPGKKSFLLTSPNKVAKKISTIIISKKSNTFFPFLSTSLFKISQVLPDKKYTKLGEIIKKRGMH